MFITNHVKKLHENDILVVTSKIIALSCGNIISTDKRTEYLKKISTQIIKTPWALLTLTNQGWCINAGIDESNVQNGCITLPEDPFAYAQTLLTQLKKRYDEEIEEIKK